MARKETLLVEAERKPRTGLKRYGGDPMSDQPERRSREKTQNGIETERDPFSLSP